MIPSSLSPKTNVTKAKVLNINKLSQTCYQGQTHGDAGFLLSSKERDDLIKKEPSAKDFVFPYMIARDLIGTINSKPTRFIIDLQPRSTLPEIVKYKHTFEIIQRKVLPNMVKNAEKEREQYKNLTKKVAVRQNHLDKW